MERPAKRPRLLTPLDSVYNGAFDNQHTYYETQDDELNDYEELEEEDDGPVYHPDQELERKRARADFKLKSTFEAIFEKYGKDFEGIGDEIDMRTGKVLVNNGHLLKMRHEMDAGDVGRRRSGQRSWSDELDIEISDSEEEDEAEDGEEEDDNQEDGEDDGIEEEDEEDYDDEDPLSDDEMEEDDMILRGFAQASQQFLHRQPPQDPGPSNDRYAMRTESRHAAVSRSSLPRSVLPSRSEILAQFGPQLGPEIVKYVSKRGALEDTEVELAWRVPAIEPVPTLAPSGRPLIKSMVVQPEPELERSPSPENAPSIWAVTRPKSTRKRFSTDEDEMLLDFVADARRHGLNLWHSSTWKRLEAMNSRHGWYVWRQRYNNKFTYLQPGLLNESDLSPSETSSNVAQMPTPRLDFRMNFTKLAPPRPSLPVDVQRPARIRRPAQRDGIVSWSEAIATIASVDPVGNAGLLDDVRRTTGFPLAYDLPVSSSSSMFPNRRHSRDGLPLTRPIEQAPGFPTGPKIRDDSLNSAEGEHGWKGSAFYSQGCSAEQSPCPHADCRPYPTILYRLERRSDEELSPMCSHLLYEHHIAPFPCGEANCERKGPRGYFMQKYLVQHVREAHPYVAALHRLRGRVDPALLAHSSSFDRPRESIEVRHSVASAKQPRDSDFMSLGRPYTSHGLSSSKGFSINSDQRPDKTLTPRAGARAASEGASSMNAHPSSATAKEILSRINCREASSDSGLKMLDEDPFPKKGTSDKEQPRGPSAVEELTGGYTGPVYSLPRSSSHSSPDRRRSRLSIAWARIPCTYPGCGKMISSAGAYMSRHLEYHERIARSFTSSKGSNLTRNPSPPTTIPSSQTSTPDTIIKTSSLLPPSNQVSGLPRTTRPTRPIEESILDRSYEFSDEEDGIRPIIRRPPPPDRIPEKPPPVPHSFFAPPSMVKPPHPILPPKPSSTLPAKRVPPQSKNQSTTPTAKPTSRKSFVGNVFDSEDFDELSLAEDGFILLSARPRSGTLPKSAVPVRVKQEEPATQCESASSTKKRPISSLEDEDEIDELMAENPLNSILNQPGPTSDLNSLKKSVEESGIPKIRLIAKPKSRQRSSNDIAPQPGSSLREELITFQTPAKQQQQQLSVLSRTPLTDLANHGQATEMECNRTAAEIPSTSELGSSPNSYRARTRRQRDAAGLSSPLTALVTPRKKTLAGRTVKQEVEDVMTPGGTLRRCGQDGFACGRTFCFRCGSDDAES